MSLPARALADSPSRSERGGTSSATAVPKFVGSATAFFVVAGLAAACRPATAPLVRVDVVDQNPGRDPSLAVEPAKLRALALAAFGEVGFAERPAKSGEIPHQLYVSLLLTAERSARPDDAGVVPKDQIHRAVAVRVELKGLAPDPKTQRRTQVAVDLVEARNVALFEPVTPMLERALARAAGLVALDRELLDAPAARVVEVLADADLDRRGRAIAMAGDRRLTEAVPGLVAILGDDRLPPPIVMQAIGALIAIGDPRAVEPLIDSARRRPPAFLGQILFGLAQIGGNQAEAYLFTVASGHPDPATRKNAEDALAELSRRRKPTDGDPN